MVLPHFPQHLECLISQLSSGRDYKSTETIHGCPLVTVQTLQHLEEFDIKTYQAMRAVLKDLYGRDKASQSSSVIQH